MAESGSFHCRLITPDAKVIDEHVASAVFPAWDGLMGIKPNRAPLVTRLGIGELRLTFPGKGGSGGGSRHYFVEGGFAHMVRNRLTLLAQRAVGAEQLTEEDAQAEVAEAEARRIDSSTDPEVAARIRRDRQRAREKLRLARLFKERGGGI